MREYTAEEFREYLPGMQREDLLTPGFSGLIAECVNPMERTKVVQLCRDRAEQLECLEEFNNSLMAAGVVDPESLAAIFGPDAVVDVISDLRQPIPEKQWVVDGICTRGECVLISGASKSGKSYLMTNLAITAAAGGLWLGRFQCKKSRVLYVNGENQKDDARARFHAVFDAAGISSEISERITMICADGMMRPIQGLKTCLIGEIRRHDYGVLILDPLYCFYQGSEIDEQDAKAFCECLKDICRETGVVIFCVHHHSKGAGFYKNASSRASGSGMLQRVFSSLLDVTEVTGEDLPEGQRGFEFSGQPRQAAGFKLNLIFDFPVWKYDTQGLLPENAGNKARTAAARNNNKINQKAAQIKEMLPRVLSDTFADRAKMDADGEYITSGDVADAFQAAGMDVSEKTIERRLDDGVDGFRRDQRPGQRRFIRRQEFIAAAESMIPASFRTAV